MSEEYLDEKYKPGVTVLKRTITLEPEEIKSIKRDIAKARINMKVRHDQVTFETAKIKTLAKILNKHIDFDATDVGTVLDIPAEIGPIDEALSASERRKRGRTMRRYSKKIAAARKRNKNRKASTEKLEKRARKKAIEIVRQKVAGKKGKTYNELSPQEKSMIDQKVQKRKSTIDRIAKKMLPKVRRAEQMRRSGKKEDINESFKSIFEASMNDTKPKKRFHELINKLGQVKHDKRFKMYKQAAVHEETESLDEVTSPRIQRLKDQQQRAKDRLKSQHERQLDRVKVNHIRTNDSRANRVNENFETDEDILTLVDDICEALDNSTNKLEKTLQEKAEISGYDFEIIEEVYNRGFNTWEEHFNFTPEQYAMNRVNSFINEGAAYEMDSDLLDEEAKSKAQQRAAGMAYAAKKGELPMSRLKGAAKQMAKMNTSDLKDYASTKHKGKPEKMEEGVSKKKYDNLQRELAPLAKERNAAKKSGNPWHVNHPKEKKYHSIKSQMGEELQYEPRIEGFGDFMNKIRGVNKKDIAKQVENLKRSELMSIVSEGSPRSAKRVLSTEDYAWWEAAYNKLAVMDEEMDLNDVFEIYVEGGGAGEWGTDKLRKKYIKDTPGQKENSKKC